MDTKKTVGLVILSIVVLIFFVSLWGYFGNQHLELAPERCVFFNKLQCEDWKINGSGKITEIEFTLKNSIGDIIITNYSVTGNLDTLDGICISTNNNLYVPNIQKITLNLTCTNAIASLGSDKKKYKIFVIYNAVGNSKSHSIQGEILARRESN